ncbi:MAG TPA: 1-deoxy-D-xylulose-5-phosphate reductoisomerase [Eggerthellaceae bacterium]|nr:1-deoxy-D-xylulose-5-phosphate reductoisomerase [Eggerthellaceae bacterium]
MSSKDVSCKGCSIHSVSDKRRIVILGSTGSIGTQTLDVVRRHSDKLEVVGLAAGSHAKELLAQAKEFNVSHLALGVRNSASASVLEDLSEHVEQTSRTSSYGGSFTQGSDAVVDLCRLPEADLVVNALVGAAGLQASYETLQAGKVLALANKESLVVGGDLIMPLAKKPGDLMPIDSEHGAIYQCLLGENPEEVSKLWVTASGGPFRGKKREDLKSVTPAQALAHPTWHMGAKITIDSSTLMNKGLEVIEAHHLFAMPYDKIEVVVQPQSAIHSMVEFKDGSVKAHLGTTDMRIPIQFALSYPDRWSAPVEPLDFRTLGSLEFAAPDTETFRCLTLARIAGSTGGTLPCAMNAANEIAVAAFLEERCSYLGIPEVVEATMDACRVESVESIDQLLEVDAWARDYARSVLQK